MKIDNFKNEYFFLSNFYNASVYYNGYYYKNNEAAFQAQKTEYKEQFVSLDPSSAKKLGRKVNLVDNWEDIKDSHMYNIVKAKFNQHPDLAQKLINTGDAELIEGNWWNDTYWGVCKGIGKNHLGLILMKVRDELNNPS